MHPGFGPVSSAPGPFRASSAKSVAVRGSPGPQWSRLRLSLQRPKQDGLAPGNACASREVKPCSRYDCCGRRCLLQREQTDDQSRHRGGLTSRMTTFAPASARARAADSPMPPAPPVITALRPSRRIDQGSLILSSNSERVTCTGDHGHTPVTASVRNHVFSFGHEVRPSPHPS